MLPYPFGEPLHRRPQLLAAGAAFDDGELLPALLPAIFKSQEVKPSVVSAPIPAKPQGLRFVQRQFQPEFRQPSLHGLAERFGLVPVIEAAHKVVRIAEQPALPAIASAHFTLKPEV